MKNNSITDLTKSLESLYLEKEYEKSADLLLKNKNKFDLGQFHFNLGTIQAKQNDFAAARYNLEKAYKLGQVDSNTKNNLNFVIKELRVQDISNSTNVFDKTMNILTGVPNSIYLSISLCLLLCIAVLWFRRKIQLIKSALFLIGLSLIPFLSSKFYFSKFQYAINLKNIKVYEGPSKVYDKKIDIEKGSKFLITGPKNSWYFIEKPISLSGWIERKDIGIL